jgi:hypothetical protein
MGQYYKIVNVKKKQYLNPHMFGDGMKLMEFGTGGGGTMAALAALLADGNGRGGGDLNSDNPIVGSWAGDNIVIAGDYADTGKFLSDDKSDKTLYSVAEEEGEDISAKVLEALLEDRWFADDFIKMWKEASFMHAGDYYKPIADVVNAYKVKNGLATPPGNPNHHSVIGSKGDTYFIVDLNDGTDVWNCSCPAYTYNKVPGTDCKHIKEVKNKLGIIK